MAPKYTHSYAEARAIHDDDGGYLLNEGGCPPVYCVCDEGDAISMGRPKAYLESLAPFYDEIAANLRLQLTRGGMRMAFVMQFDTDNAAFEEGGGYEVARILKEVVAKLEQGQRDGMIFDVNGNKVGSWFLELELMKDEEE